MKNSFLTFPVNYTLASGDYTFPSMPVSGSNVMCTAEFSDLDQADATVELHQSIDGIYWGIIPDSKITLAIGQSSHTWNVIGLVRGCFIRVALTQGTVTTGTCTTIKVLSHE